MGSATVQGKNKFCRKKKLEITTTQRKKIGRNWKNRKKSIIPGKKQSKTLPKHDSERSKSIRNETILLTLS